VIALVPTDDFTLDIRASKDTPAGDLLSGQCLTLGAEVLASFPQDDTPSLGAAATSFVSNALERLLIAQIEPLLHILDGFLAYLIGVGKTLGGLVQSQNMARCSPPDLFLKDVVRCACGDQVLQIPYQQRVQGVQEGALWCTGVLGMIDSNNQPYYVHNKYTYAQLQAKASGLQAYVDCVGQGTSGYKCVPPNEPFFAKQGVTTVNVLVKCRENYLKRRWDPAAYMLFQPASWDQVEFPEDPVVPAGVAQNIASCLSTGDASTGSLAQHCHGNFLRDAQISSEAYWQYERANETGPEYTDGCLVFSGPAEKGLGLFKPCVDGMVSAAAGCTLPAHLWSPRSDNDVPLAAQHRVLSHGVNRDGLVQSLYAQAHDTVMGAIAASLAVWNSSEGNQQVNAEFFSVEGDLLHQTMDCMFMGPYSRVDYWPIPDCSAGEECLRGPFWSRDEEGGQQRHVDPSTCSAPVSLPYTCGSPGRKSLMRFLVLRLLHQPDSAGVQNQNSSNVAVIMRATLAELADEWGDTARYGCACADASRGAFSPSCCASNQTIPLLPEHLDRPYTSISSRSVLMALEDDMATLYDLALENRYAWTRYMQDVAPNETQGYNWATSKRAEDEAFFDPTKAGSQYSAASEAMSPLLEEDSTLWDVCHASLKQVFFTLPVDSAGDVRFESGAFDGDAARLEEFVRAFTAEAYKHSPLFRHYSPRHAPSWSQMCAHPPGPDDEAPPGSVRYDSFVQAGTTLIPADELPSRLAFHPQRFQVGANACLCGWSMAGQRCFPPQQDNTRKLVCDVLRTCTADGSYSRSEDAAVLAAFSPAWHCPEVELSPHWGFLDPSANEEWLGQNKTSSLLTSARDLFRHGRAGLRPGNLNSLPGLVKQYVNPQTRLVPLARGRLTTCHPPPPPGHLLEPFLNELFPAAQGVEEAGALSHCLRYAIELARLEIFRLLDLPDLRDDLALQREVAERWRKRCGTQLHLLHLCVSLGVFKPLANPDSRDVVRCPHFQLSGIPAGSVVYTTPQCLVSVDGAFYDPCRCPGVECGGDYLDYRVNLALSVIARGDACRLRFDPRDILLRGAPIGWINGQHPLPDPEAVLLRPGFPSVVLQDSDAVGNVPLGRAWDTADGPMEENSEFCDAVLDWWPEDWDFPVGYHVTVPCDANDTAYRGFTQAFALDEAAGALVYQHDLLRDASLVDSHYGGAGLCRSGTFGMPMPETNNMRFCTRIQLDDTEDFTLPRRNGLDATDDPLAWADWKCTTSSAQLPWPDSQLDKDAHQSARFSVGTIPNMPAETSPTYPSTSAAMFKLGPWQDIVDAGNNWGTGGDTVCQDFALIRCLVDATCPTRYSCRGKVCMKDYARTCVVDADCGAGDTCRGVCVDPAVQCIKHRDCPGGQMCTGVGTCETPVLAVQNRLDSTNDSIALGMAAQGESCGEASRVYSLMQGSYWGNTGQDVLRAHGMCSFEDWFKYTHAYTAPECSTPQDDGTLLADPERCKLVDLELLDANLSHWWPAGNRRPELMFVRPTVCDRDYERLQGFSQCAPVQGRASLLSRTGVWLRTDFEYDQFVRLHNSTASRLIRLAVMPEINSTRSGFLGMQGAVLEDLVDLHANPFVACGGVGQCYPPRFTVNGTLTARRVQTLAGTWANYSAQDGFICGAFGLRSAMGCVLDVDRFPLYRALCLDKVPECRVFDSGVVSAFTRACASIPATYQASNQDRAAVLQGLRDLFHLFPLFDTVGGYLQLTGCMSTLHTAMSARAVSSGGVLSTGLYFPFMFALYEVPFDWFYQCVIMSGTQIQVGLHTPQTCQAYATRASHDPAQYQSVFTAGDSFQTYLQHVRAGYLPADYAQYRSAQLAASAATLQAVVLDLVARMFPRGAGADLSYPRCSKNILWRVGPYGDAYGDDGFSREKRAIIWNWHDSQSCTLQWHEKLLTRLERLGINRAAWIEAVTDPDPKNMERQDGAGATSVIAEARAYILSQLDVQPLDTITSGISGALQFQNLPPPAYDFVARPLPASLTPMASVSGGTTEMDDTVSLTCVFLPPFDPAFTGLPDYGQDNCGKLVNRTTGARTDYLRTCAGDTVDCSAIPIYYKRNGRFNCRYSADSVIRDGVCTENSLDCVPSIMDAVYAEMVRLYREKAPPSLPILAPVILPWFASGWRFDAVDLSAVLDYERNIQPDPTRAIMCEITADEDSAIRFTECNNPHYLRLKEHVRRHYKHEGAVKIPAGSQLEWPMDRRVLARGIVLYYANTKRTLRKRYLDALFDDETVCKGDPAQHVCRQQSSSSARFTTMNPWTLGNFNPYEVCDVAFTSAGQGSREFIYTYCLEQGNPACQTYLSQAPDTCRSKHRRLVQQVGVPREDTGGTGKYNDYNLCQHVAEEDPDGCMHDQGLLGGFDGLPIGAPAETSYSMIYGSKYADTENYTVGRNLYEESRWSIPQDFRAGVFAGTNPLWSGKEAPYGHLQINEDEIGGHRIGVAVLRNDSADQVSTMILERLAMGLGGDKVFLDDAYATGNPTREWVGTLQADMLDEHEAVLRTYNVRFAPGLLGATCPLQRWVFYSGEYTAFSPAVPAVKRAQHLFHRVHGGRLTHPTMLPGQSGLFLGKYRSSNGFCACPIVADIEQSQCRVPISSASSCSLLTTMRTLMGKIDSESYVFPTLNNEKATRYCEMQLDWPLVDGTLRDGTTVEGRWGDASSPSHKQCHVLDRLRPFRYKYKAADALAPSGKNTVQHGSCQTRRLVSLPAGGVPARYTRCLRTELYDTSAVFMCNTTDLPFSLPRRARLTLDEVLARRDQRRLRCAQCSRPPAFRSQQGRPIPPESSFGRLHRVSPERLLAKDLREALCPPGPGTGCPALNESAWRPGEFMRTYLLRPHQLFQQRPAANTTSRSPPAQEDPGVWSAKPWVYCPTARTLRTGEGCQGTISRADWISSKTTVCPRMVRSFSSRVTRGSDEDPMSRTTFCPIDNTTDSLCHAITKARELVRQANCIARGDPSCMPSPFVYHPASYEPSNNAWVHDSVKAFYSRIDAQACPHNTSTDAKLAEFARAYQRTCPANGVNVFVGVLQAVRVIVVDAALLLTTLIAMVFRTLQLFIASGRDATRQQIGRNWAYVRAKARTTLDTVGDLLVDTMLNSGDLGAKIMGFLQKSCQGFNTAAEWFLNVWCNYIQKYTLQFLSGMRKLIGITGAGFEILQDFMDEIFQGVLPAAFVAKYAMGTNFQGMLAEFYTQPSKKNQKTFVTVNGKLVQIDAIPDTADPRQESRTSKSKSTLASRVINKVGGLISNNIRGIGRASGYAAVALAGYDMITGIISLVDEERLRKLYPDNFTLFDLSDIVNVVDDLEDFILSPFTQQTCASFQLVRKYNPGAPFVSCLSLDMDRYSGTSAGTTSIDATMCWADAAPSLGQNSMFACTAGSTCRRSASAADFILCNSCPEPVLAGINKYGCDSLLLQCACSQLRVTHTLCASNRECDDRSECELVSSLNGVSYGTMPCSACPNTARRMCLLPTSGMPGRCSCMLAGAPTYDLCSDQTGTRTPLDSSRMCGYLHNRKPDIARWVFDMDDLIMLRCAQVSTGICSEVYLPDSPVGEPLRMVVAETLRAASGRRLLQEEDEAPGPPVYDAYESEYQLQDSEELHALLSAPGWNATAAPCSTLALAYQAGRETLGLLETHVLRACGFWRYVGRRVIARYNLTEQLGAHETFLLSMDDLVFTAMTPQAGLALLWNPSIFVSAYMHHAWMKPVRALGVMIANQLEYLHWIRTIDADVHDALFGDLPPTEDARQAKQDALQRIQERISPRDIPRRNRRAPALAQSSRPSRGGRALLTVDDILAYSARIITQGQAGLEQGLPTRVYGAWSTASFAWPPRYNYSLQACPIALSALDIGLQVATINKLYFEHFDAPARPIDRSLRGNLPVLGWNARAATLSRNGTRSWPSTAFHWMLELLSIKPEQIVAFFTSDQKWSLTWLLHSLTKCDLASTLTCSRHDKDLLMSTIVFVLLFLLLTGVSSALGVPFLSTLFLLSYPWFILWYVFGMAPSCAPLLPTCLLSDVISIVETVLPSKILFPAELVCDANQTCLRSCAELGFDGWLDPLAFALCDTDDALCTYIQRWDSTGVPFLDDLILIPLTQGMARFQGRIAFKTLSLDGFRLCTWVSFVSVTPLLALFGSFLLVAGVLVVAAMDLLPAFVALVCQAFVFFESG
jgi:hypothetical protein